MGHHCSEPDQSSSASAAIHQQPKMSIFVLSACFLLTVSSQYQADFENVEPELEGSVGHLGNYPTGATKTFLNSNLNWVIKPVGLTTAVYSIGNIPITLIQTTVG